MGLFDTLLGRTKPVRANLDSLFALPGAAVTLQVSAGLVPTGKAGVCFKPPAGQPLADMQAQIEQLLDTPDAPQTSPGPASGEGSPPAPSQLTVRDVTDSFGYRWILIEGGEIDDLVTRVHMVHSSLEEGGWSTQLLCSVFGLAPGAGSDTGVGSPIGQPDAEASVSDGTNAAITRPVYLVYLAKRGTFYPFAPSGKEQRDTELELRLRGILGSDLPVEGDLSNWFPIWDLPIS